MHKAVKGFFRFRGYIWNIGYRPSLGNYEKRKLGIFNTMNFLGLLAGIILPLAGLSNRGHLPVAAPLWKSLVWLAAIFVVFVPLAVRAYRRAS